MNTRMLYAAALLIIAASMVGGCSQMNEDLPAAAPAGTTHDAGWDTPSASNFHGKVLKSGGYNSTECRNCHGRDSKGGTSGIPCSQCHAGYPHPTGWDVSTSSAFHGTALKQTGWDTRACDPCHAPTYQGGTSGVSCYASNCHPSYPHSSGWNTPSTGFHGLFIQNASWDMRSCKSCHGSDYAGGRTEVSCTTCHSKTMGPENCTTCHGGTTSAPPADVKGNTATTVRGVGAHQVHITGPLKHTTRVVPCTDCHTVPGSVYDPGHVDTPVPAEVPMASLLARTPSSGLTPVPSTNSPTPQTVTCANTYCHGAWRLRSTPAKAFVFTDSVMIGSFRVPSWTGGAAEAACGTCHGLPPTGHVLYAMTLCTNCHGDVVDASGNLKNKALHINGKINLVSGLGGEYSWPR